MKSNTVSTVLIIVSLLIFLGASRSEATKSKTIRGNPASFVRLEFGRDNDEGLVLVQQSLDGLPAYTLSYYVHGSIVKTQPLISSYFLKYRQSVLALEAKRKSRDLASELSCHERIRIVTRQSMNASVGVEKRNVCFDMASVGEKQRLISLIADLKRIVAAKEI